MNNITEILISIGIIYFAENEFDQFWPLVGLSEYFIAEFWGSSKTGTNQGILSSFFSSTNIPRTKLLSYQAQGRFESPHFNNKWSLNKWRICALIVTFPSADVILLRHNVAVTYTYIYLIKYNLFPCQGIWAS